MKNSQLTLFAFFFILNVNAQNTLPTSGNIGIGTITPNKELEIKGGDGIGIRLFNNQANTWDILNTQYGKLDFVRGGSNTFMRITQNGYVGIGTTTPSHLFSLGNNTNTANLFKVDGIYSDVLFNGTHTTGNIWSFINTGTGPGTRLYIEDANNSSSRLTFDFKGNGGATDILSGTSNGYVGIGNTSPNEKFQIGNSFTFHNGGHKVLGFMYAPSGGIDLSSSQYAAEIRFDPVSGNLRLGTSSSITNNPTTHMNISKDGNIGIGATDTKGFKLGVNGKIAATEVKVATYNNWADFVFNKDYNLPTLQEVEQHIEDNGHLKGIPSAEEVKKEGFYLGEMDSKLLQKIEELTLYTIEQEKKIEELSLLKKENELLRKKFDTLEALVSKMIKKE